VAWRVFWVVICGCIAQACAAASAGGAENSSAPPTVSVDPNEFRWDLAPGFEFDWDSVELSAKVPKGGSGEVTELALAISMKVKIVGEAGWVSIDVNRPVIHEALDGDGRAVECLPGESYPVRLYEMNGWRWDERGTHSPGGDRQYNGTLLIRLPVDANHPVPSLLSQVTGCIHVLDGKIIEIDVPFAARDGKWLDFAAAPDLLFRVDPSTTAPPGPIAPREEDLPIAWYNYETGVKSQSGQSILPVWDDYRWYPRHLVPFGDYAMIRTELLDSQRDAAITFSWEYILTDHAGVARCYGMMPQNEYDYDMIRHVIVMGPADLKVPFVLTDVPIPGFGAVGD
jgi:hypothetical protein